MGWGWGFVGGVRGACSALLCLITFRYSAMGTLSDLSSLISTRDDWKRCGGAIVPTGHAAGCRHINYHKPGGSAHLWHALNYMSKVKFVLRWLNKKRFVFAKVFKEEQRRKMYRAERESAWWEERVCIYINIYIYLAANYGHWWENK